MKVEVVFSSWGGEGVVYVIVLLSVVKILIECLWGLVYLRFYQPVSYVFSAFSLKTKLLSFYQS